MKKAETGGKALEMTLKSNQNKIQPNEIIDTYNHTITGGELVLVSYVV